MVSNICTDLFSRHLYMTQFPDNIYITFMDPHFSEEKTKCLYPGILFAK